MFRLRRPSEMWIRHCLANQTDAAFTYEDVGVTRHLGPPGDLEVRTRFDIDRRRAKLGSGEATWERARAALQAWEQFDFGWAWLLPADTPLEPGHVVGVLACTAGLWSFNTSRLLYVLDETDGPVWRWGIAYGTLPHHVECGEELFSVEWDRRDDTVTYCITAVSHPRHWLVKLGYRFARHVQRCFAKSSIAAMRRAVGSTVPPPADGLG